MTLPPPQRAQSPSVPAMGRPPQSAHRSAPPPPRAAPAQATTHHPQPPSQVGRGTCGGRGRCAWVTWVGGSQWWRREGVCEGGERSVGCCSAVVQRLFSGVYRARAGPSSSHRLTAKATCAFKSSGGGGRGGGGGGGRSQERPATAATACLCHPLSTPGLPWPGGWGAASRAVHNGQGVHTGRQVLASGIHACVWLTGKERLSTGSIHPKDRAASQPVRRFLQPKLTAAGASIPPTARRHK